MEIFGFVSGLLYLILEIKQNKWMWLVNFITAVLYAVIFAQSKLYAAMGLQIYYVLISVYGFIIWQKDKISHLTTAVSTATIPTSEKNSQEVSRKGEISADDGRRGEVHADDGKGGEASADDGKRGEASADDGKGGEASADDGKRGEASADDGKGGEVSADDGKSGGTSADDGKSGGTMLDSGNDKGSGVGIYYRMPNLKLLILSTVSFVAIFVAMLTFLRNMTGDPMPAADAFTTSLSIIATFWLGRAIIHQWVLWIIVDIISVVMFFSQGLYPTALLYLIYTFSAVYGYIHWKRKGTLL